MVNAQLAVEAAIKETENYGTVTGHLEWAKITPNKYIDFTVTNKNTDTVYRLMTDATGNFSAKLPAGEYILKLEDKKKAFTLSENESIDIGSVRSVIATVDFDAVRDKMKDNMQEFLSKINIY